MFELLNPDRSRDGTYIILIGANTSLEHRGNLSLAYQVLLERGYDPKDFYILDSASRNPYYPKTDWTTRKSIKMIFEHLKLRGEGVKEVIIYVTGHGTLRDGKPHIMLNPSETIAASEFLKMVDELRPKKGFLFLDQCYWGKELVPKGCQWTTVTVSTSQTTSSGVSFPRGFWRAFRELGDIPSSFVFAFDNDIATKRGNNSPYIKLRCDLIAP